MTRQRRVIHEELCSVKTHPTAEEVFAMVRKRLPRISLGTVYRNLDLLCRTGRAIRLESPAGGQRRFDGNANRHYHVRCRQCGKMADIVMESLSSLHQAVKDACGFEVLDHRLEFVGVCPDCREEKNRTAENAENAER